MRSGAATRSAGPGGSTRVTSPRAGDSRGSGDAGGGGRPASGRRSRRRLLVASVAAVAVAAGGAWLVGWSPVLGVADVTVVGSARVDADKVVAAAAVEPGTPLARVDTEQVRARVLAALPRVADVEVRRGWPRDLVIVVDERVPVGTVATDAGWQLVDAAGTPYLVVDDEPAALPSLQTDPGDAAAFAATVAVAADLPEDLRRRVTTITATTVDDVTLTMRSGAEVTWGSAEDGALKARVLAAMLALDARAYDVSAPNLPTSTGAASPRGSDAAGADSGSAANAESPTDQPDRGDATQPTTSAGDPAERSTEQGGRRGDTSTRDRQALPRQEIARGSFPGSGDRGDRTGSGSASRPGTDTSEAPRP